MPNYFHRRLALTFFCCFCCLQVALAQTGLTPAQKVAIDRAVMAEMQNQEAVGVAIGVIVKGQIVYLNGYGWEDRENQIPVSSKTMFRWASMSKSLTAVAAMQLVEQQKLDLDADVRGYVPEFPDKGVKITSRQLLCHQSGIPHSNPGEIIRTERKYDAEHPFEDVILALDTFKETPLLFKPGEKYDYSTPGYILLSAVVQRAGEKKFADQVQDRIAKPLGMTTLQPDYQWVPIEHRAVGYRKRGGEIVPDKDEDVSWKLGGGGFISNVEDLARFAQGLILRKVLTSQSLGLMWRPQPTSSGEVNDYGLGFHFDSTGGFKVWHEGRQEKVRSRFVIYPQSGTGAVVFCNTIYGVPGKFSTAILRALRQN